MIPTENSGLCQIDFCSDPRIAIRGSTLISLGDPRIAIPRAQIDFCSWVTNDPRIAIRGSTLISFGDRRIAIRRAQIDFCSRITNDPRIAIRGSTLGVRE